MNRLSTLLVLALLLAARVALADAGRQQTLSSGPWKFLASADQKDAESPAFDDHAWTTVAVPHTWASHANQPTYANAWYRSRFSLPAGGAGQRTYICFEGVATVAEVFVNGRRVGGHRGAYTRFTVDATEAVKPGAENVLAVRVSNDPAETKDCLPSGTLKQLYHVYGGIYRKVWLLTTGPVHVDPTDSASSGVSIRSTKVGPDAAEFTVKTPVRNASATRRTVTVRSRFFDPDDREVAVVEGPVSLEAGGRGSVTVKGSIARPKLWGPGHPHLYRVRTELIERGAVLDAVDQRTGFRSFTMDHGRFVLNGVPILLRGVCKHQETEDHATAVTDRELIEDWETLSALGVNFVRMAHYPHAALEYDQADERGILVWCENGQSNDAPATETGKLLTREMVLQNANHPSIAFWSVGNEAGKYPSALDAYAAVVKAEDATRPVTYADNRGLTLQKMPHVDFLAANKYPGWYGGGEGAALWNLDYPYVSETGGGGVISAHAEHDQASHRVNKFEPIEYQQWIVEARLQAAFHDQRDSMQMLAWWAFRDFGNLKYKGINTKGLLTYAGFRKDTFYLFQAFLRPETPVIHIASQTYFLRRDAQTAVKVYANAPSVSLTLNGTVLPARRNGAYRQPCGRAVANVFYWPVTLQPGKNTVVADDGRGHEARCVLTAPGSGRDAWVDDLRSSNPANPAYFIDQPVQAEWPFYAQYDGTGDNTFHALPAEVGGACWIATKPLSKPGLETTLRFVVRRPATVLVMFTDRAGPLPFGGFADTGVRSVWRDNNMNLVPCRLVAKRLAAGEAVQVDKASLDYVVLVKPAAEPAR